MKETPRITVFLRVESRRFPFVFDFPLLGEDTGEAFRVRKNMVFRCCHLFGHEPSIESDNPKTVLSTAQNNKNTKFGITYSP